MPSKTDELHSSFNYGCYGYANVDYVVGPYLWHSRSRTWSTTPNYSKLRKGELPMNPYDDQRHTRNLRMSTVTFGQGPFTYTVYGPLVFEDPGVGPYWSYCDSTYTSALSRIPTKLNGAQFELPLFSMELKKTLKMIQFAATDIVRVYTKHRTRRQANESWLEYRYGWRLLLKDIYDGLCAIHDLRQQSRTVSVTSSAKSQISGSFERPSTYGTHFLLSGMAVDYTVEYNFTYGTNLCIRFKEDSALLGDLQQFGITNPISLAWELLPYSFVLDWFIPVSNYLNTLDMWIGKSFVSGTRCDWTEMTYLCKPKNLRDPFNPGWVEISSDYQENEIVRRYFKRTPLATFPSASLPNVQFGMDFPKALDAISLLAQVYKPRR